MPYPYKNMNKKCRGNPLRLPIITGLWSLDGGLWSIRFDLLIPIQAAVSLLTDPEIFPEVLSK